MNNKNMLEVFYCVVNKIKSTSFSEDVITSDYHLGGDLGIDSREMLEVWYELEDTLGIIIDDTKKRDIYTVQDVLDVLDRVEEAGVA